MKRKALYAILLSIGVGQLKADQSPQDAYLRLFIAPERGDPNRDPTKLEKQKDYLGALACTKGWLAYIQKMQQLYPDWEKVLLAHRAHDLQGNIDRLEPLATQQYHDLNKGPNSDGQPSIYVLLHDGDGLEKTHDYWGALNQFEKGMIMLEIIHRDDPIWESSLVEEKTKQTQTKIDRLETLLVQGK